MSRSEEISTPGEAQLLLNDGSPPSNGGGTGPIEPGAEAGLRRSDEPLSTTPGRARRRFRLTLRVRALLTLGLLASLSSIVVWSTLISYFHDDKTTYIKDQALDIASNRAVTVGAELRRHEEQLRRLATALLGDNSDGELLAEAVRSSPDLVFVAAYGSDGRLRIGSADEGALQAYGLRPSAFRAGRGSLSVAPDYLLTHRLSLRNVTESPSFPSFAITIPIELGPDQETGFLHGEYAASGVLEAIERSLGFDIWVLERNGDVFAHPEGDLMMPRARVLTEEMLGAGVARLAGRIGDVSGEFTTHGGEPVLAAYASVETGGLGVVARRPLADAYLAAGRLTERSLRAALAIIGFTVLVALFASRMLTRRLSDLAGAAQRLRAGDFDLRMESQANDEIGDLGRSLCLAAEGLRERDAKLTRSHERLLHSEKLASFGRFAAGIVHEVKNPLANISLTAELGGIQAGDPEAAAARFDAIRSETERCVEILQNLLGFTRADAQTFESVSMNRLITELGGIMRPQLRMNDVKLISRLEARDDVLRGDRSGLTQLLMNLVLNAVDAMADSEIKRVTISTRTAPDGEIEVRVSDTGPGIPIEIRARIFDPFFTSKPEGKGTGLGLYVTSQIVARHAGHIEVCDSVDGGAEFFLRFPLSPDAGDVAGDDGPVDVAGDVESKPEVVEV